MRLKQLIYLQDDWEIGGEVENKLRHPLQQLYTDRALYTKFIRDANGNKTDSTILYKF